MLKRFTSSSLAALALVAAVVGAVEARPSAVPDNLKVPAQNVQLFTTSATGVQVYICTARPDDPSAFTWTFKAPEADLHNEAGEKVGHHYAGPTWEANDGSKVTGEVVERADAPDPSAIPWLLLKAKTHEGSGVMTTVTYVQRLETVGGVAPADGCDASTAGAERGVEYQATYVFSYGGAQ